MRRVRLYVRDGGNIACVEQVYVACVCVSMGSVVRVKGWKGASERARYCVCVCCSGCRRASGLKRPALGIDRTQSLR
jgi:hypothetical protein